MFLARLLLIFLLLPLLLVIASSSLSLEGRFLLLFVLWPAGLILFAVLQYLRDRRAPLPEEERDAAEPGLAGKRGRLA